ncbi:helix-turn-helix domain-containing protein [Rudaea cellulosilytica]|jgi:CRP/FNR family transcriptional regulator|uniref:helix-turn-helix domain-containing protein n=1 Tax=Rudaea cellulosilytica TaxID=540746 RepID=UPI000A002850|nr:cyclic nucleotide-binding domain-containing protein [Rudaea cellulosilytica]
MSPVAEISILPTKARRATLTAAQAVAAPIDIEVLSKYVNVVQRKLTAGQYLYRAGQPFNALYLVNVGFLKTCLVAEDGREQVTGFRMRGDLVGIESIGAATHECDVVALETSGVWELPYPAILRACAQMPELQERLTWALAAEIRSDRSWKLALNSLSAEQRVAAFLLDLASRHEALGFSPRHFVLRMGRADIGSFLALKHETVTRALTRLAGQGCIDVQWREIRILDMAALDGVIHCEDKAA